VSPLTLPGLGFFENLTRLGRGASRPAGNISGTGYTGNLVW